MSDQQQTLSIPTLILAGIIGALVIRYFLSSSSSSAQSQQATSSSAISSSSSSRASGRDRGRGRDDRLREQAGMVLAMFPQAERRDVLYDLSRNGANVAATTERVLQGMLPRAPTSYRAPSPSPVREPTSQSTIAAPAPKSRYPDLIQRYKLDNSAPSTPNKSNGSTSSAEDSSSESKGFTSGKWSANKDERRELLKKRQAEMILKARQKMLSKEGQS